MAETKAADASQRHAQLASLDRQVRGFEQSRRAVLLSGFCYLPSENLVAMARGKTPDPIPNSAVKTLSADGTAAQAAEE